MKKKEQDERDILRRVMTSLARKGGRAAAQKLTRQERVQRASKAGRASAKARAARKGGSR